MESIKRREELRGRTIRRVEMLWNNYNVRLRERFGGERVQKISVNAGMTCPNRDGTKGVGGCAYCNNVSFQPEYCFTVKGVREQIVEGIEFFARKYKGQKYLAYFQSYTNTYGKMRNLVAMYEEALSVDGVVGLVVGTRPDCVDGELLDWFGGLVRDRGLYVMVEYGVESTCDDTLMKVNRGHDFATAKWAIEETKKRGVAVGAHLILGLPGEDEEVMLGHANRLSELPLDMLKLHQLQIVRGTKMEKEWAEKPEEFALMECEDYIELCAKFIGRLSKDIAIERFVSQVPKELLIAPDWGLKNYEFVAKLEKRLAEWK